MNNKQKRTATFCVIFSLVFSLSSALGEGAKKPYRIVVTATAYCPCSICCGKGSPGVTKTGRSAWLPGVAVDPRLIPLGSHIDIPGYERGPNKNGSWIICDDIGGAIKGNHIDVRFKTHKEAKRWGVKKLTIRVHRK